jgi:hypothetical protein
MKEQFPDVFHSGREIYPIAVAFPVTSDGLAVF